MKKSVFARSFAILLISCIFCSILSGCGSSSKSSSSEPPVYSPLRVLVPEAPGSDTLGSSPLTLDVSNITQGYFAAQSDSADLVTSLQITAPTGVLYSYFIEPGKMLSFRLQKETETTRLSDTSRFRETSMQRCTAKR